MGMTITIRIERTELDPQGLKELLAMTCENLGYGVQVVSVRADQDPAPPPRPSERKPRKSWEERQKEAET